MGSLAKTILPSGIASTSPVKRRAAKASRGVVVETLAGEVAEIGRLEAELLQPGQAVVDAGGDQKAAAGGKLVDEQTEGGRRHHVAAWRQLAAIFNS